jgi:hypothetical protein
MVANLKLSPEQLKTLKLFSYYCGSHGANTAFAYAYLAEYGTIDYIDNYWYSETNTRIDTYDKIDELIEYILRNTNMLDYYNYEGNGTLMFEIDGKPFNAAVNGDHEYLEKLFKSGTLIGKQATVKYFELTTDGIPRFPKVIYIRDGVL